MSAFAVNRGQVFAQPYASRYARLRHCFIANPGIPYSVLIANLRMQFPAPSGVFALIDALNNAPARTEPHAPWINLDWNDYRRQCPACAQRLYHTDLFAVPWVMQCPLHRCVLTTVCPQCGQPWPSPREIPQRRCPTCGMPTPAELHQAVQRRAPPADYQPIAEISALLSGPGVEHRVGTPDSYFPSHESSPCCVPVPFDAPQYPRFLAALNPAFGADNLQRLGLATRPLRCKTARLTPRFAHPPAPSLRRTNTRRGRDLSAPRRKRHRVAILVVAQRIAAWIARHSATGHRIALMSYRGLQLADLVDGPDLCPYCLAFNLWLFRATATCEHANGDQLASYPFCEQAGYTRCLDAGDPLIWDTTDAVLTADLKFRSWYYRRALELAFVDRLHFALDLRRKLLLYRNEPTRLHVIPYASAANPDRYYAAAIRGGRLDFYYEHTHPLQAFDTPIEDDVAQRCSQVSWYYALRVPGIERGRRELLARLPRHFESAIHAMPHRR